MTIELDENGKITWHIYRKHFKKARYKKAAQRDINWMLQHYPGHKTVIIMNF